MHIDDGLVMNRNFVLADPSVMRAVPCGNTAIGHQHDGRRIAKHAEGVLGGFVIPAIDSNGLPLDAVTIAVFAEKNAVAETGAYMRNFRREVENAGREEQLFACVSRFISAQFKMAGDGFTGND